MNSESFRKTVNYYFKKEYKKTTLEELYSEVIMSKSGDPVQQAKVRILRMNAVIQIISLFGLHKVWLPMAEKLIVECERYSMFDIASSLANLMSRYSAILGKESAKGYYDDALRYNRIYKSEIEFNWQFNEIRSKFGTPDFHAKSPGYLQLAETVKETGLPSVRLIYIYHELCFFHAFTLEDMGTAAETCRTAIDYFDKLPYDHQLAKNIFTFHLIDVYLLSNQKLAEAELLITNSLQHHTHSKSQKLRFLELLKQVESRKKGVVVTVTGT